MTHITFAKDFQGVADVFLRNPNLYAPILQFIEKVMTGPSDLTKEEREIIAAHVSAINDCTFCLGAHRATLLAMGVDRATVDSLEDGIDMAGISGRMRAAIGFATKLSQEPELMDSTDIQHLRDAGWKEETIEDLINVIALFAYVNRLVDAFGITGNTDYFDHVGAALAKYGYAPLIKQAIKTPG